MVLRIDIRELCLEQRYQTCDQFDIEPLYCLFISIMIFDPVDVNAKRC